ncbi:MAG: hypothetical protein P4L46_12870 [Fimbriimonas sp.]|nr:hypothetical protein [Fimbriimonas sp.]
MAERRFSEKEVGAIIQQATALQLEGAEVSKGATLVQIQQAAAELGISPELVSQAALQVDACQDTTGFQFFGAPLCNRISLIAEGALAEDDLPGLTQAIRSATGRVGFAKQVGTMFEWSSSSDYPLHIAFTPKDRKTSIDITARFDSYALLCLLLPMLISMVAWLVPSVKLGGMGILLWGLGQLATYLVGRTLVQRIARKKLAALRQTADTISSLVSKNSQALEPVPISSIGAVEDAAVNRSVTH